jgi:hypothetical protein
MLPSAGDVVRFVVDAPTPRLVASSFDREISELHLEGYETVGAHGEPALPGRVVTIAVPPAGEVTVRGVGGETERHEGVRLLHAAARPVARLVGLSWMRDQRVARIAIHPTSYDAASRRLSVHRRVEVEVSVALTSPTSGASAAAKRPLSAMRERDPFEQVYRSTLANYEQGKAWRRSRSMADRVGPASAMRAEVTVPDTSIYAGRRWVKIAIPATGFYRVDFGQVRNSALFDGRDTVSIDSLRLFVWPGVPVLPEESYCDSCDYREVAIGVVDADGQGAFDDNEDDYFYFYALGSSDWTDLYAGPSDPPQPDSVFLNHPYETRNYYYLTVAEDDRPVPGAPRRIGTVSGALTDTVGAVTPATFMARAHFEQDLDYMPHATPIIGLNEDGSNIRTPEFWEKFFWTRIQNSASGIFQADFDLPGIEPSLPARVRLRTWGTSALQEGRQKSLGVFDHYLQVTVGPLEFPVRGWNGFTPQTFDTTLTGLGAIANSIRAQVLQTPDSAFAATRFDEVAIAWFDVFYPRRFEPVANELVFDSDAAGGSFVYRIGPFSVGPDSMPRVFDVTDPLAPLEVLDVEYLATAPGQFHMRFHRVESGRHRYRIVPDWLRGSKIVRPPNSDVTDAPSSSLENLRRGLRADYLLIYYDGFRSAVDVLLPWRRYRLPMHGRTALFDTMAVPISALYDQFSGGRTDPAAIRNFLRAAYYNWDVRPTFVTLLGDASYDFKDLLGTALPGQPGALVPSYDNGYDHFVARHFVTDDWLLNVDDAFRVVPDFLGGRIPAGDAAAAMTYARDKLIAYESSAPLGEWRDRVMLIADDNEQGDLPDALGWEHLEQTVELDQAMPHEVDRLYVYLHTYPDEGQSKPGAKADIKRAFNEGVVLANYVGHGSSIKLSDEGVFLISDAEELTNRDRLSVLVAASCDVGRFDNPMLKSLGEVLVLKATGGAVGVISATELAISPQSGPLNLQLFREIFRRDSLTGRFETTLAEALLSAKSSAFTSQKYQLMGDAALKLVLPQQAMEVTLHDLNGVPLEVAERGRTFEVRGRVLDRPGGSQLDVDGLVRLLIEDSAPVDTTTDCLFGDCVEYPFRASPVFRGDVSVTGGSFTTRFVMPMNARLGPRGRSRGYAETGGAARTDGAGSDSFTVAAGSPPTDDREGPRITLSFVGGATRVRPDALLRVDLFDPSGILITGNSPQNGIIVTIDDNSAQRADITSSFRYAANSYQAGTAFFRLPGLSPGPHRIRVSAADNLAAGIVAAEHRSSAEIEFEVVAEPLLQVTRAILFPNPVRSGGPGGGGQFVVDAPGDSVDVVLTIYTVSGRRIRSLRSDGGQAQVQLPWDGLDAEGSPLARGVYLFKAQVFSRQGGRQRAEADGRLVVLGRVP